MITEVSLSY